MTLSSDFSYAKTVSSVTVPRSPFLAHLDSCLYSIPVEDLGSYRDRLDLFNRWILRRCSLLATLHS